MVEPQTLLSNYWVGPQIGKGARSVIYEVKRKSDGQRFAAKFVALRDERDSSVLKHLENEHRVLTLLHTDPVSDAVTIVIRPIEFVRERKLFKTLAACLVVEYVQGQSLADYLHYSLEYKARIFHQVCRALEYIHSRGLVHADLKPENIMVSRELKVKLIDFGFALPIGTEIHGMKGTWGYLAPEQAGGRLSLRTDVFNLGGAMYLAFTGQKLPSILPNGHEKVGFVPVSQLQITPPVQINPCLPADLSSLILRCCSLEEGKRPSVTEVKVFLDDFRLRVELGMSVAQKQ